MRDLNRREQSTLQEEASVEATAAQILAWYNALPAFGALEPTAV